MPAICWYYEVSQLADPGLFERGMAALAWENRREQVMRFRFEKDRQLHLGAGLLLAFALRRAGASDLTLRVQEYGKPALADRPDIHFNLSHSGSLAVCAVSEYPVGVDVEKLRSADRGVALRCFQPREQAWMERSADKGRAFTRLWTRKESYMKLLGVGLSRPLDSFSVLPGEPVENGAVFFEHDLDGHLICACTFSSAEAVFQEWRFSP